MNQNDRLLDELRGYLPEYMAQKRMVVGRGKKLIRCINPQHSDSTPSMSYYPKTKKLHCFGCGATYDLFDVIRMDYPDCDSFPRQVKKACELFGVPFPEDFGRDPAASPAPRAGTRADAVPAGAAPLRALTPAARISPPAPEEPAEPPADYGALVEEGLRRYGAGGAYFAARGIPQRLCEKYSLWQDGERAWMPVRAGGRWACYCARALREETKPRYKNSPGAMELFGGDHLAGEGEGRALFITEAIFDALSVEACGYQALALCGAGNTRKFLSLCAANPAAANSYTFFAAGDNDEAGRRMNAAVREGLAELGISCGAVEWPEGAKDANELLLRDPDALHAALDAAANADRYEYERKNAASAVGELLDLSVKRASRSAVPTGFPALDDLLDGGLYAGLYIIGAISSLGKTSYLLQIADSIAAAGSDVLYFSLEMSKLELMAKSISRISYRLDPSAERSDAFTARQVLRLDLGMDERRAALLSAAVEAYKKTGERLYYKEGLMDIGVQEVRAAVREHIRLRGRRPVVFVDYLQILKPSDPRATDKQNTDRAVVELKRISRDFDIPVFAVSSFNRENYRNAVSMEAFKESGAVEYSSDVLFGLQLAGAGEQGFDVNAAKARSPRAVELVMLKNRNGVPYAKIEYAYNAKFSYFGEGRRILR